MPVFEITTPDGKKLRITAPDGATREQALERVKTQYSQSSEEAQTLEKDYSPLETGQDLHIGSFNTGIKMSPHVTEFLAGMGRRMTQIGSLGMADGNPEADKRLDNSGYAMAGSMVTDIGGMALGGGALGAARNIPKIGKVAGYLGQGMLTPKTATQAASAGALYGGATSQDRLGGSVGGFVGGGLGQAVPNTLGKVVKPYINKATQSLRGKGVPLTTGEIMGGGFKTVEEKLISMPLVGDVIRNAKHRSLAGYGRSVVDDALKPIGKNIPDNVQGGREIIDFANGQISKQYDDVLSKMTASPDEAFSGEINNLLEMSKRLPPKERNLFVQIMHDKLYKPFNDGNGVLLGKTFKEMDSGLRTLYKKLDKSQDIHQNNLGNAVRSAHKSLIDLSKRQNQKLGSRLDMADVSYAKMSVVDDAASMLGAETGEFTPAQLLNAIKKNTGKKKFAAGKGFNQPETEAAKKIMAGNIPNSGTADRLMLNMGTMGALGFVDPTTLLGVGGVAGLYSKPAQTILNSMLFNRPAGAATGRKLLEQVSPYSGLVGAISGRQLVEQ